MLADTARSGSLSLRKLMTAFTRERQSRLTSRLVMPVVALPTPIRMMFLASEILGVC